MRKSIPTVRDGKLIEDPQAVSNRKPIVVGSDAWFSWLETAQHFAFEDPVGRFTARKRPRLRTSYWYAFKRLGGQYYETYIGKSDHVRLDKLQEVADDLKALRGQRQHTADAQNSPTTDEVALEGPRALDGRNLGLLQTKLGMPRINAAQLVSTRATQRLVSALEYPLTVVSAPPGYGKSTLLAQWIAASNLPAAWVSLDASDNDPSTFRTYTSAALDQVVPGVFRAMRPLLHVNHSQVPGPALTRFIQELASAPNPTLLVLDDYHKIASDNRYVHEVISYFVEHLPPQVHMVIASRIDPPLPLARLRASRRLLELRATDLAFTAEESRIFLIDRMRLSISAEQVAALNQRTEGWVGALQLAALTLRERPESASSLADSLGESRYLVEYLVEEVLEHLSPEMRSFLLRVALLDSLTAPLCDTVTGSTNGQAMLAAMERANLFMTPLDDQPQWYRLHSLVATALRHYDQENQPEIVPQIYIRASAWCEANDHSGEAISYAFAANDLGHAAALLESYAEVALARGYLTMLREALDRLPDEIVRDRPRLCVAHAYVLLMSGERVLYPRRVRDAEEAFAKHAHLLAPNEHAILEGEVLALRAGLAQLSRHTPPRTSIAIFQQALDLLPDPHPLRNYALACCGANQILEGNVRAASQTLMSLLRTSEAMGDVLYIGVCALYLGMATLLQGRLDEALALCRRVVHYFEGSHVDSLEGGIHLVLGRVLYERNELNPALDHLSQGLATSIDLATPLFEGHPVLAAVHHAQGDDEEARRTLEQSLAHWERMQSPSMRVYEWTGRLMLAEQVRLWLIMGDAAAASEWVHQHERWIAEDRAAEIERSTYLQELEDSVLARAHLAQRKPLEALDLLVPLGRAAEAGGRMYRFLEILVLQAVAYDALDDMPHALSTLGRALALAAPEHCIRTFADGGPAVPRLVARFLDEMAHHAEQRIPEISTDYLAALAPALGLADRAISGARWPAPPDALVQLSTGLRWQAPPRPQTLTSREMQVLTLIERGFLNKEIARELLPVKVNTVKHHVQNIFAKLDVHNRTEAVARAHALHLLPSEPAGPGRGHGGTIDGQSALQEPEGEMPPEYLVGLDRPAQDTDAPL